MFYQFYTPLESFLYHSLVIMILLHPFVCPQLGTKTSKNERKRKPQRRKRAELPALVHKHSKATSPAAFSPLGLRLPWRSFDSQSRSQHE